MNWRQNLKRLIRTPENLEKYISVSEKRMEEIRKVCKVFRMSITPYYLSLADKENEKCPIRKMVIPSIKEIEGPIKLPDKKEENRIQPVKGIRRRYPDRCLLIPSYVCPNYCRFCFRKFWVGRAEEQLTEEELDTAIKWIRNEKKIREVIITGGEPLLFSDAFLRELLSRLREINHIEVIRLGTRMPVFLPQRITNKLAKLLSNFLPIYVVTHFNHPKEITKESKKVCERLNKRGIILLNQTVLLKGINDDAKTLGKLFLKLLSIRVKPYYLFHCIDTMGSHHFVTRIQKGTEIIKELYCHISGMAIPIYAVPTYHGKVMCMPNYIKRRKRNKIIFESWLGEEFEMEDINEC